MENNKRMEFKEVTKFIGDFMNFCLKYKYIFILSILLGGVLGFCYAYFNKTKYEAKLSFIINESKVSNQNSLANLTSQLNIGSSSLNLTEDKILFLIGTKKILGQSLLTKYDDKKCIADKLIEVLDIKQKFKKHIDIRDFSLFKSHRIEKLSYAENKIIDILINQIIKSNDLTYESVKKKTNSIVAQTTSGIILISYKNEDEILSQKIVTSIYNNLSEFYIETITKNLKESYELVSKREDSLKKVISNFENQTAEAFDDAIGVYKFRGKIKQNRLRRDTEILNAMYAEVLKNREIAKFNLEQERPVLQIIDEPALPLEQHFKSKIIFTILGIIGFTLLFLSFLSIYFFSQKIKT
jgi:uncharacterized protein involved in exopolysaccharide biosynthesis